MSVSPSTVGLARRRQQSGPTVRQDAARAALTYPRLAGLAAVAVGVVVLIGWITGTPSLSSLIPGTLTMKANTAIAFVAIGLALVLGASPEARAQRVSLVLAAAAGALASIVGLQYILGVDLGVDQALFREPAGTVGTVHPGRMSPQTAAALIAIAVALAAVRRPGSTVVVVGLALLPITLGALNLLDALLGAATPTLLARFTQMALPTAALCLALGVGVIAALPGGGPLALLSGSTPSAALARRLVAAAVVIPFVLGWLRLEGERAGLYDTAFGVALVVLATTALFLAVILLATRRLREAEFATQRAATEIQDLYDGAPAGYHSVDADGRFVQVNQTELDWLGYRRDELLGRSFVDLLTPASAERFAAIFPTFLESGRVKDVEYDLVRRDGSILPVLLNATAIRDADGGFVMSRTSLVDISARREAELAREEARVLAESANHAKSEFLGRMSHELRTPLNAVLGFGQILEMGELDEEQREYVRHIGKAGAHLLRLIDEVIDISRIETGTMTLSLEPVEVSELADELLALIRPMAAARRITIDPPDPACQAHVLADRHRIRQVLLNLLSNAVKYNRESGTIAIECAQHDDWLRISVRDSGHGMRPDQVERLFVPFDRLGAEATGIEGTGIGLALSRSLVEAMGGRIGVDSRLDEGTTFWIELPLTESQIGPDEPRTPLEPVVATPAGPSRTLLHIDDNLSNQRLIELLLRRRPGVRVVPAAHARLGLELARTDPPALILLDLHLPDMNGLEVLRELRRYPVTRAIPVVVVSADASESTEARVMLEGATAYMSKPLNLEAFLATVDEVLAPLS